MNEEVILEEVRRALSPLLPDEPVDLVFQNDYQPRDGDLHYATEGGLPLEFFISPRNGDRFTSVHVIRVGDFTALDSLPVRPVPESDGLPDDIWVPDDPFRADYEENLPHSAQHYGLYTHVCRELRPSSILEIGVRGGYSAWAMLQAVPDATYLGIDLNHGTWGGEVGYMYRAVEMLRRRYPTHITVLEGDSQEVTELPRNFDLAHVDGNHGHDAALHDLELCFPYADHILIDDTSFATTVASAVCAFLERHPDVKATRYDSWRGLVVIDTRGAKGHLDWGPDPLILFERPNTVEEARAIILDASVGLDPEMRWRDETSWLLERMVFPSGLLLDIGCGIGRLSGPLARRKDHAVLGIESSAKMRGLAADDVDLPEQFSVVPPEYLAQLVAAGLRAQGALAIWALQHVPAHELTGLVALLWQALEPGAVLFTLDGQRCIPTSNCKAWWWWNDRFDQGALLEREGFALHMVEDLPPNLSGSASVALKRWIRRR